MLPNDNRLKSSDTNMMLDTAKPSYNKLIMEDWKRSRKKVEHN